MKGTIIIFFARPWAMTDENTGENREGVSIQYVVSDTLAPITNEKDGKTESYGYQVTKESISVELAKSLQDVPGIYEAKFDMKAQGGKNVLCVSALTFISPLQA